MPDSGIAVQKGLSLINESPFRRSLPSHYDSSTDKFDVKAALEEAESTEVLSDARQFLESQDHVRQAYNDEIGSKVLKDPDFLSASLLADLSEDSNSSYLKIKILSEFAVARIQKNDKLLNLDELKLLTNQIDDLAIIRDDIKLEIKNNSKLVENALNKNDISAADSKILRTLLNSTQELSDKLHEVSDEFESKLNKLNSQYVLALSLCKYDDIDVTIPQSATASSDERESDEIISYIASVAAQRNVTLPAPNPEKPKSQWAIDCFDSVIASQSFGDDTRDIQEIKGGSKEEVKKLTTALNDLKFAHKYLTRQYEDERNLNTAVMDTHKKKKIALEKKLSENIILLEKSNRKAILVEHEKNVVESKLDEKIKEVNEFRKELARLKIDGLGFVRGDLAPTISPGKENRISPTSPLTGVSLVVGEDKNLSFPVNPKTPLLQQNVNNYRFNSPSSPKFNSSISVLRKEFKRLVSDMHNDFESELEKEKIERKRLENLLKLFEDDMDTRNSVLYT